LETNISTLAEIGAKDREKQREREREGERAPKRDFQSAIQHIPMVVPSAAMLDGLLTHW
jgi:hypothetical protein